MEEKEQTNFKSDLENNKTKSITFKLGTVLVSIIIIIAIIILLFNKKTPNYNIIFETNGGSVVESISVSENSVILKPENPTKEGYRFIGWFFNNEIYDFSKPVTSDMKLEARWGILESNNNIILGQKELKLSLGETSKLIDTIKTEDIKNDDIIWENNSPDIVSVDENGNITALKEGTATIIIKNKNGKQIGTITIFVSNLIGNVENVNVTGVYLNKTKLNLTQGATAKLIATLKPNNATNKNVTWKSSNSKIVSVDKNGNVKALQEGTATIIVTTNDGGYTAKATITVSKATTPSTPTTPTTVNVSGVSLDKTTLSLTEGENSKLTATVNPSNATNKNVTWSSSNSNIVSVDSNGNIRALQPGSATITVTTNDGNYKASCQVTVKEKPAIYSVKITPIVEVAETYQYSITVTKDNNIFNGWTVIQFNNGAIVKPGQNLPSTRYKDISSAKITLSDGTTVTATVYK